jgi:AcrR family transcriptional regulator
MAAVSNPSFPGDPGGQRVAGDDPVLSGPLAQLAAIPAGPAHRERLVLGMVAAVAERGYAATTITDVVRHARVSRRTFYEHFADKESCFLAAYDAVSDAVLTGLIAAAGEATGWEERIVAAVRAYLGALAAEPAVARVFTVEILSAGPAALARRRSVLRRFAEHIQAQVTEAIATGAPGRPLTERTALALAGAVHELVLEALEAGRAADLPALDDEIADLVRAIVLR